MRHWMARLLAACATVLLAGTAGAQSAGSTGSQPGVGAPNTPTNPTDTGTVPSTPNTDQSAGVGVPTGTDTTPGSSVGLPGSQPATPGVPDTTANPSAADGGTGVMPNDLYGPGQDTNMPNNPGQDTTTIPDNNPPGPSGTGTPRPPGTPGAIPP